MTVLKIPEGVKAVLTDGRVFYGPLWQWRGKEGWFSLVIDHEQYNIPEEDTPYKIYLRDCVSAVDQQQRTNRYVLEDVDLIERARAEGWNGK